MLQAGRDHSSAMAAVGKEALLLHSCAHPGVVQVSFLGLAPPLLPGLPTAPCLVEYFGMPVADLSLEKLAG